MQNKPLDQQFPLSNRIGSVLYINSNEENCEINLNQLHDNYPMKTFQSIASCDSYLKTEFERHQSDLNEIRRIIKLIESGRALIREYLEYWNNANNHFDIPKLIIANLSSREITDLKVLAKYKYWHGSRVLLIGHIDSKNVINFFNAGLIDYFLPSQAISDAENFHEIANNLIIKFDQRRDELQKFSLSAEQLKFFENPAIAAALNEFCKRNWIEYFCIGHPFGILGLTTDGVVSWLQFEHKESVEETSQFILEDETLEDKVSISDAVRNFQAIVNFEVHNLIGEKNTKIEIKKPIEMGSPDLLAAHFLLPATCGPRGEKSYSAWRARQQRLDLSNQR